MSYIKKCENCGRAISIREMPNGYWIPFDVQTDEQHICQIKNYIKMTKDSMLQFALEKKKDLVFKYNKSNKVRHVTPVKILNGTLNAYCYYHKDNISFKIKGMSQINLVEIPSDLMAIIDSLDSKLNGIIYDIKNKENNLVMSLQIPVDIMYLKPNGSYINYREFFNYYREIRKVVSKEDLERLDIISRKTGFSVKLSSILHINNYEPQLRVYNGMIIEKLNNDKAEIEDEVLSFSRKVDKNIEEHNNINLNNEGKERLTNLNFELNKNIYNYLTMKKHHINEVTKEKSSSEIINLSDQILRQIDCLFSFLDECIKINKEDNEKYLNVKKSLEEQEKERIADKDRIKKLLKSKVENKKSDKPSFIMSCFGWSVLIILLISIISVLINSCGLRL